jgi:hypothetical protein
MILSSQTASSQVNRAPIVISRAAHLMRSMLGVGVSTGFVATVRHRAAQLLEPTFLSRVRELLRGMGVLHVDETPGRAGGGLEYVHVAATPFLTAMHTGGRSAADIDAEAILPGYTGTIVRDGYAGYTHLIDAHHTWCGAHYPGPVDYADVDRIGAGWWGCSGWSGRDNHSASRNARSWSGGW